MTKDDPILNGDTVNYQSYDMVEETNNLIFFPTTAIFTQEYLISMGFKVNNEIFKDNALYFRNALVRANYTNYSKGIKADKKI